MNKNKVLQITQAPRSLLDAVKKLEKSGYNTKQLSNSGPNHKADKIHDGPFGMKDRVKAWGTGALWGLLSGLALFSMPPIGPTIVTGPFIATITGGFGEFLMMGGIYMLFGVLTSLGMPNEKFWRYAMALKYGRVFVAARGARYDGSRGTIFRGQETP